MALVSARKMVVLCIFPHIAHSNQLLEESPHTDRRLVTTVYQVHSTSIVQTVLSNEMDKYTILTYGKANDNTGHVSTISVLLPHAKHVTAHTKKTDQMHNQLKCSRWQ